jgi:bacterioferritin-associated ferredoxin
MRDEENMMMATLRLTKTQRMVLEGMAHPGTQAYSDGVGYQLTDEHDAGGFVGMSDMGVLLCNHYIAPVGRGGGRYAITQEGRDAMAGLATPVPNGGVCQKCQRQHCATLYNQGSDDYPSWQCGTCVNREARRINTKEMYRHGRRGY